MSDSETDSDSFDSSDADDLETDNESDEEDVREEPIQRARLPWFRVLPPEDDREDREEEQTFNENVGPREMPEPNSRPVVYFFLMMTIDFLARIVTETNRYAAQFITNRDRIQRHSRLHAWFKVGEVTLTEMKGFFAVILNMGLIRKATISEYWNCTFKSQETAWFRRMFSRNRFQLILKFFHLVNNADIPPRNSPDYLPTSKFQSLVDHFNSQSSRHLIPEQNLSIDESLIATRGRSVMLQYIPSKSAKWGVKCWMLVEAASGYLYRMNVYKGRMYDPTPRGITQGSHVVNSLLNAAGLMNKWYHVICDSFFTSLDLTRQLFSRNTFLTGTIRKNKPMPQMIKEPQIREKEFVYARQGPLLMCSYRERANRKPVRIISTMCKAIQDASGKPEILNFYNKNMGGVDLSDMMVTFYQSNRKSMKVWKKVVFNLIHRMVINAYVLYRKHSHERPLKNRLQFIQNIIQDLSHDHMTERDIEPRGRNYANIVIRKIPNKRQLECSVCSDRNGFEGRRRARTACRRCGKGLHKDCIVNHICIES